MSDPTLRSSGPTAERLYRRLPGWYRHRAGGDATLEGILAALGAGLDASRDDLWRLLDDMFVETCAPELVPLIGDLVGVSVDPEIPVQRQRHQVKYGLFLRRRTGTAVHLETLAWQIGGMRATVEESPGPVTGEPGAVDLHATLRVAWPVRRVRRSLVVVGPDLFALDAHRPLGLRHADGTPILRSDDPELLVGLGRDIEVRLSGDLRFAGSLRPVFTALEPIQPPIVAPGTIAIDPETGRVAGPPGPTPGTRAHRDYGFACWIPQGAVSIQGSPASLGGGQFVFNPDGREAPLTDADGYRLISHREQDGTAPVVSSDARLLVAQDPLSRWPFLLYPPGVQEGGAEPLPLDRAGLDRLFRIVDRWGWPLFPRVRLVTRFDEEPPADDQVDVDLARGRFHLGVAHRDAALTVMSYRRVEIDALVLRTYDALRHAVPLGRRASFTFLDTAPGQTQRFDP